MRISDWSSDVCSSDLVGRVCVPPISMQPVAADDVAESLSHIVCNRPAQGVFEIAGPDRYDLADLALKILAANEEKREVVVDRSEEHTSELQSLMRISYAVFCLKKKTTQD